MLPGAAPTDTEDFRASPDRTSDTGEYLTAVAVIAIGVIFWIGAADFGEAARRWPVFLCFVVTGLGIGNLLALVFRNVARRRGRADDDVMPTETAAQTTADEDAAVRPVGTERRRQITTGLFAIAYAGIGYGAGFLVATALLVPLYILLSFRPRRPLLALLVTLSLLVFMRLVFTGALNAPLHRGTWVGVDLSWLPF